MPDPTPYARYLRWFEVGLSALVLAAFFLPWHVVHHTNALEGLFRREPPPPVHDVGEPFVCTGFSHNGQAPWIPIVLGLLLVASVLSRGKAVVACSALKVGMCVCVVALLSSRLLAHLFERQQPQVGEYVFLAGLLLTVVVAVVRIGAGALAAYRRSSAQWCRLLRVPPSFDGDALIAPSARA